MLALEIDFRREQNLQNLDQPWFKIDFLPAYVISEELIFKDEEHPGLTSNLRELLVDAVEG